MANDLEDTSQKRWTPWLFITCLTIAGSASFGFGYGISGPNQLKIYIRETFMGNETQNLTNSIINDIKDGLPQTLFTIANGIGAFTGSRFGAIRRFDSRRKIFYANFPFYFISIILVIISYYQKWYVVYLISRLFHGYQGGMACAIVPPYINEISSRKVRGAAGTVHQLFITIGILAAQVIGLPQILGSHASWHWGFAVGAIPSVLATFIIRFLPDSPVESMLQKNDEVQASNSLRKLRNSIDITNELNDIKSQQHSKEENINNTQMTMFQLIKCARLRLPFVVCMIVFGGQALSGINAVFYYSTNIFKTAGVSENNMPYAVVLTGLINVIATVVTVKLMERIGRRALIIFPGMGMSAICLLLTILICVNANLKYKSIAWVIVIMILAYVICFAVGWGPVPFIYCTEVFRHDSRDAALVLGLLLNYLCNTIVSLSFPALNRLIGGYVFAIFMAIMAIQICIFWKNMPETKNKTIEQIEAFWCIKPIETNDQEHISMQGLNTGN